MRRDFYLHVDSELGCFYLESDDPQVEGQRYRAFLREGWSVTAEPLQILKGDGSIYAAEGDRIVVDDYDTAEEETTLRCGSTHDLWLAERDNVFIEDTTDLRSNASG
ncbi:MAG: hypothetical protein GY698_01680 [Actinomycetia bacterium]|nr:hypothetical protein [Actinomycetes bacterium]